MDVGETDPCEEWGSSRGWLGGLFSPLNDLNQTGKKLWTANANRTRNNTWIPEKIFGGSLELVNPRSTANCVALPIIWTKPATAVRAKPLLSPVPFNPLERIRDRVVTTSTAPMAITSNATATVSKDPGTEMLNESSLKKLL